MRISLSSVEGREKVETYLKQALPAIEISFDGPCRDGYDVVGTLEVSSPDIPNEIHAILERAGRNIIQAMGGGVRVLCHLDGSPDVRWANNPSDCW